MRRRGNRWHTYAPIKEIRRLYAAGLSSRQIAARLGWSAGYISRLCRDIARNRSVAAQLRQPPTSKSWRASRDAARKKVERAAGVKLPRELHVHHKDEDHTNNDFDNLEVLTATEHAHLHRPPNPVPRWLRPERRAYMREYLRAYTKRKKAEKARVG